MGKMAHYKGGIGYAHPYITFLPPEKGGLARAEKLGYNPGLWRSHTPIRDIRGIFTPPRLDET